LYLDRLGVGVREQGSGALDVGVAPWAISSCSSAQLRLVANHGVSGNAAGRTAQGERALSRSPAADEQTAEPRLPWRVAGGGW
jgi:hypothetical protein